MIRSKCMTCVVLVLSFLGGTEGAMAAGTIPELQEQVKSNPGDLNARNQLGTLLFKDQQYIPAQAQWKELLRISGPRLPALKRATILRAISMAAYKAGDKEGAWKTVQEAHQLAPDDPKVTKLFTTLQAKAGAPGGGAAANPAKAFKEAVDLYEDGYAMRFSSPETAKESYTSAIERLQALVAQRHRPSDSNFYLGSALLARKAAGDLALAKKHLEASRTLDQTRAKTHMRLGELYGELGDPAKELTSLETADKMDSGSAECHYLLALALDRSSRPNAADQIVEHAKKATEGDKKYKAKLQGAIRNPVASTQIAAIPVPADPVEPPPTQTASTGGAGGSNSSAPTDASSIDDAVKSKTGGKGIDDILQDKRVKNMLKNPNIQKKLQSLLQ